LLLVIASGRKSAQRINGGMLVRGGRRRGGGGGGGGIVFDNTCDISYFRAHIFCPRTTQQLPKKYNEAGPLPTDALS